MVEEGKVDAPCKVYSCNTAIEGKARYTGEMEELLRSEKGERSRKERKKQNNARATSE